MSSTTAQPSAKRIFIFDNPRNRSHLFYRLLATHPALGTYYHAYLNPGVLGPEKIHYDIYTTTPARNKLVKELWEPICQDDFTYANSERDLLKGIADIEAEGKIPLINEHCSYVIQRHILIDHINSRKPVDALSLPANPTVLPDDLWEGVTPMLMIRHPAHAQLSLYRSIHTFPPLANLDPTENHSYWFGTLTWSRMIFEALQRQGRKPIVVDGDDICTRTAEVIKGVCAGLGLDPAGVSDTWEPGVHKPAHPVFAEMTRTIWESDGIKKYTPDAPVTIEDGVRKMEAEFGPDIAAKMKVAMEDEMDNYNFLARFKV